jgi:hypothetical protein
VTFLTLTGSKVDVFHQSQPLTQSSDVTHAVRVVKNVTFLSSLVTSTKRLANILKISVLYSPVGEYNSLIRQI